ncbi:MAG: sigma-70 family RNA polymerase sigma factor [Herpetosiphonaceae bacterium]|nr:sigma-70 family RNA polymerase sigma factor [Herpetosiphonaceae bacterium]
MNQRAGSFVAEPSFSSEASDDELIAGLVAGHIAALDTLYTRYSRPVFSLAFRILNDTSDAEEITQDVFERVWRNADAFDSSRGRFGTWLLSMTHHIAIDMVRRHQRRPQTLSVDDAEPGIQQRSTTHSEDVSEVTVQNLEAEQVRRMLRSLPAEQRQAIELAYFGGLSHLEIAAKLGDPLGTVKTRIRRGMERLRTALEGAELGKE